jgi:NTE family protein
MKGRLMRTAWAVMAGLVALAMVGCATTPVENECLTHFCEDDGYRMKNILPDETNSDSLFVVLTFSGGGTRAASFSYGVLEKLRDTEIVWEGKSRRLLDEVDVISSVSGGSLTAAYYGLFGDQIFTDYKDKVLYENIQGIVLKQFLALRNLAKLASPFYGRSHLMADTFDRQFFEGKTFGDLLAKNERPFIIINSTNASLASRFEFTQDQFDLLYSDLGSFPIGHAVAASAAFPGLLTPMALRNHEKGNDFRLPAWVQAQLDSPDPGRFSYQLAQDLQSYALPGDRHVHLVDGGVSDNLGVMPVITALRRMNKDATFQDDMRKRAIKRLVIITVNAKRGAKTNWDTTGHLLGLFKVLGVATSSPLDHFSQSQIEYLRLFLEHLTEEQRIRKQVEGILAEHGIELELPESAAPSFDWNFVEVVFDRIEDEETRGHLNEIPTSFSLPQKDVDRLVDAAGVVLDEHADFQRLIAELR